jgi:hypothetical protein
MRAGQMGRSLAISETISPPPLPRQVTVPLVRGFLGHNVANFHDGPATICPTIGGLEG